MSGGAGKVYFVLYLAVVLELLIIIVERDEAEEGLLRKQRETMKIVESILSQLQSGAGTEGINTRPKDEITIPPDGVDIKEVLGADIKSDRQYIIEVGITDISGSLKKIEGENDKDYTARLKDLVSLANVREIEYQVFYNDSDDPSNPPEFPDEAQLKAQGKEVENLAEGDILDGGDGAIWHFRASRKLVFDKAKTFDQIDLKNVHSEALHPVYPLENVIVKGPSYVPRNMPEDSTFFYSAEESLKSVATEGSEDMKKRSFVVNFQPPGEAGWYKLRFISRTNRILGVKSNQNFKNLDEEAKVNIGTVQLT
ncbi:MAG: hypothetical protein KAH48_04340, partial [Chlorobi bacterium]|nr:hypothetical protein [Chlorobiota bacterium]